MKRLKFFSSELWLGSLVALLSVLVALAAYQSGVSDSKEGDLNVEGQKQLTDSNGYYLEANQYIIYDYTMYDGWYVNEGKDDDAAEYYLANFSEALTANIDRGEDLFDEQYYEEMYADANATYDEAVTNFDEAQKAGDRADKLQLVVLIFAVGLALAAYGSLLDAESRLRLLFSIGSVVALAFGLVIYFGAIL
ncbi:MAG TPA: hypothetical protein PKM21_16100 [Anaerolineales bacterium]|nr:hypothetical protein [Anaerolineales bacterium]